MTHNDPESFIGIGEQPRDPKLKRRWLHKKYTILFFLLLLAFVVAVIYNKWLSKDVDTSQLYDLAWPALYKTYGLDIFTERCPNDCYGNGVCNKDNDTYCTCNQGFVGFDCSLELCKKCRVADLLVIGVQKGGTTALHAYLKKHPAFQESVFNRKDHFFDLNWDKGLISYFSSFDVKREKFDMDKLSTVDINETDGDDDDDDDDDDADEEDEKLSSSEEKQLDDAEKVNEEEILENDFEVPSNTSLFDRIRIGGSPKYMIEDISMARIYALHPWVKFIILLRDPTDRAYSAAMMNERKRASDDQPKVASNLVQSTQAVNLCLLEAKKRKETLLPQLIPESVIKLTEARGTDLNALYEWFACFSQNPALIIPATTAVKYNVSDDIYISFGDSKYIVEQLGYITIVRGMYYHQINLWFTFFKREQFKIIDSLDLLNQPQHTINSIENWLGVAKEPNLTYKFEGKLAPENSYPYPPISAHLKKILKEFYKPYNDMLYTLISTKMRWSD